MRGIEVVHVETNGGQHFKPLLGGSSALKYCACVQNQAYRNSQADQPDQPYPAETAQQLRLRPYLPHAPGARMT